MEHFIDIYNKKKFGPNYCKGLLDLSGIKINLKVDGKPFQVLYNEETDELEWHGRSGNETTIGPLIDDYTRLFSKPVNDAIAHIEPRKEVFKQYKFLTFEVIDKLLLLTAVVDKNDNFINDASEIQKIADKLDTDIMPTLWEGKLSEEQKQSILDIISTGVVPEKDQFVLWVKNMFDTYKNFPKTLISRSEDFIEGIVLFFEKDNNIIEYKIVDPTYRQLMKDRDDNYAKEREKVAEYYEKAYNIMVDYLIKNAKCLDNNQVKSMQLNFFNMISDEKILKEFQSIGKNLISNNSETYTVQIDRVLPELKEQLKDQSIKNMFELFMKTFYKGKKRAFIISKEFQDKINSIIEKMQSIKESLSLYSRIKINKNDIKSIKEYINKK